MVGRRLPDSIGGLSAVDQQNDSRQFEEFQGSGFGDLGAEEIDPEFFMNFGIGYEQMNVAHRDAAFIYRRELGESSCREKEHKRKYKQ